MCFVIDHLDDGDLWPSLMVRWELELLTDLGFGLDLNECAGTGSRDNLIYVSPKSGRAVSQGAGEPYKDKLLKLPLFLRADGSASVSKDDLLSGMDLTGYFLEKYVYSPRGLKLPESRYRLQEYLKTRN